MMAATASAWENRLNIISGVLGAVIGTTGVVAYHDESGPSPLQLAQLVLGVMIGLVSVLMNTWRLSAAQQDAVLSQAGFAMLARDLMCQLAQPRGARPDARVYLPAKLGEIEHIKVMAPLVSTSARRAYTSKCHDNPIYSPDDQWDATLADAAATVLLQSSSAPAASVDDVASDTCVASDNDTASATCVASANDDTASITCMASDNGATSDYGAGGGSSGGSGGGCGGGSGGSSGSSSGGGCGGESGGSDAVIVNIDDGAGRFSIDVDGEAPAEAPAEAPFLKAQGLLSADACGLDKVMDFRVTGGAHGDAAHRAASQGSALQVGPARRGLLGVLLEAHRFAHRDDSPPT